MTVFLFLAVGFLLAGVVSVPIASRSGLAYLIAGIVPGFGRMRQLAKPAMITIWATKRCVRAFGSLATKAIKPRPASRKLFKREEMEYELLLFFCIMSWGCMSK